jgi:phosphate transport system substrate-binding protein
MPADGRQTITDPAGDAAYPIVSYYWILLNESYADAAKDFLGWGLKHGQDMAAPIGYIPLPEEVSERAAALLRKVH